MRVDATRSGSDRNNRLEMVWLDPPPCLHDAGYWTAQDTTADATAIVDLVRGAVA
jgi:hypothetical protein